MPRPVKQDALAAADVLDWSLGDWILAAAAEHGPVLVQHVGRHELPRRPRVDDATFTALYLTSEERQELDDQATACGLNRSAFVTAVARLGLGQRPDTVVAELGVRSTDHHPPDGDAGR